MEFADVNLILFNKSLSKKAVLITSTTPTISLPIKLLYSRQVLLIVSLAH